MNNQMWFDAMGWLGATALLFAYVMVSSRKMETDSARHQFLNIVGSLLLVVNTIFYRAYRSSFVNLIWAGIAVLSITMRRRVASRGIVTKD
jgi:phosphoglycerol transferase MdoB-like AlkP superfamily enzyme